MYQQAMTQHTQQGQPSAYGSQQFGTGQTTMMNTAGQSSVLQDQDFANFILSELKRSAREYTTAALEASNPTLRRTFESQLQQTLHMQEQLFQVMQQQNMYGGVTAAPQQDIHKEIQNHAQKANKLQTLMEQSMGTKGNVYARTNHPGSSYQTANHQGQAYQHTANMNNDYNTNQSFYSMQDQGQTVRPGQWVHSSATAGVQQHAYSQSSPDFNNQPARHYNATSMSSNPTSIHAGQPAIQSNAANHGPSTSAAGSTQYQPPQESLYQTAAKESEFNTTAARQTASHTTGPVDKTTADKEDDMHGSLNQSKYMM